MFSILLAVSLVLYLIFTVVQYGIVSVRKSNALSNKTSPDWVNGGGKFSEEQIKLTLDGLRLLTFGAIKVYI